jgi:hypothetical protein
MAGRANSNQGLGPVTGAGIAFDMPQRDAEHARTAVLVLMSATAGTPIGERLCRRLLMEAVRTIGEEPQTPPPRDRAAARMALVGLARTFKSAGRQLAQRADVTTIAETFEQVADHLELLAEPVGAEPVTAEAPLAG